MKPSADTILKPKHTGNELEYKQGLIDDIYMLNLFRNQQDKENKDNENEEHHNDNKKYTEHKSNEEDKQVESKGQSKPEEPKFSNPKPVGTLRLANHNHDRKTMIDHINRFYTGTPMEGTGEDAVDAGMENNIDPYALAAISATESTCGKACASPHNPFGRKDTGCRGYIAWDSFSEALHNEAHYLVKYYLNEGLTDWYSIGHKYCETDGWANSNMSFQAKIRDN